MTATIIRDVTFRPFDVELTTPFGIATGSLAMANNVLVRVELEGGAVGLGEAAPFPAVNGETQAAVLEHARDAALAVRGLDAARLRTISRAAREAAPGTPTLLCAIETAALDAFARHHKFSLFGFFGGAEPALETDITIVTGSIDEAFDAARRAASSGFRVLKVKVGGASLESDVARLRAIARAAPSSRWLLDGNTGFSAETARELLKALGDDVERVVLFEQPVPAEDLEGLRAVAQSTGVPVAADESARSAEDVARVAVERAANVVNVKISKAGLLGSLDMIAAARAHGLGLMVGGMVESKVAMTTSACLAAGIGGFAFADLDTPLFMKGEPTRGGYEQEGPVLRVDHIAAGHGVTAAAWPEAP